MAKGGYLKHCYWSGFTLSTPLQITLMTARIASGKK